MPKIKFSVTGGLAEGVAGFVKAVGWCGASSGLAWRFGRIYGGRCRFGGLKKLFNCRVLQGGCDAVCQVFRELCDFSGLGTYISGSRGGKV